jgi:hypothetical protein
MTKYITLIAIGAVALTSAVARFGPSCTGGSVVWESKSGPRALCEPVVLFVEDDAQKADQALRRGTRRLVPPLREQNTELKGRFGAPYPFAAHTARLCRPFGQTGRPPATDTPRI